jgi:hypothetical protein
VLSAALVRRHLLSVIVAAVLSSVVLGFFGGALYSNRPWLFLVQAQGAVAAGLGALLLVVAQRLDREGRDLDRPVSRARLAATGCALVLLALAGAIFLHVIQLDGRRDILNDYPAIARRSDGSGTMVMMTRKSWAPPFLTDDRHRRIEGSAEGAEVLFEVRSQQPAPRERPFAGRGRLLHGVRYEGVPCGIPGRCYAGSDGLLHIYRNRLGEDGPSLVKHVGKATGGRFSSRAELVGYWGRIALIADRADGQVWRYDLEHGGPGFEPFALPGGDRFVEDLTWTLDRTRVFPGELFTSGTMVVRGERGVYVSEKRGFSPAPAEVTQAAEELERQRQRPTHTVELLGPVSFRVSVPSSPGGPVFSHTYAPYRLADRATYAATLGLSLLRPPLLSTISLAFPRTPPALGNPTDEDARILLDPLVMLGNHWILGLHLLVTALLTGLTVRRLARMGVPMSRRIFWGVGVAVLGPVAYVVGRACEPARSWLPMAPATEPRAALIIRTAA